MKVEFLKHLMTKLHTGKLFEFDSHCSKSKFFEKNIYSALYLFLTAAPSITQISYQNQFELSSSINLTSDYLLRRSFVLNAKRCQNMNHNCLIFESKLQLQMQ